MLWAGHSETVEDPGNARYFGGSLVLLVLLVAALWLGRRELASEGAAR